MNKIKSIITIKQTTAHILKSQTVQKRDIFRIGHDLPIIIHYIGKTRK
jgi:PII-like signaling protein